MRKSASHINKILFSLFLIAVLVLPVITYASVLNIWEGTSCASGGGGPIGACTLCDALIVIRNIVNILFEIAIPITTIIILWGAIQLMISGGSEEKVKRGRATITGAVTSLVIALAAWLIVNEILHLLTGQPNFPWNQINCP